MLGGYPQEWRDEMKTADCRKSACMELRTFTNEHGRTETLCNITGRIPGNCNCPKVRKELEHERNSRRIRTKKNGGKKAGGLLPIRNFMVGVASDTQFYGEFTASDSVQVTL